VIIEKPKREDWKTLLIMLPTALVIIGVMIAFPPTRDEQSEQCEQISTTPVATVPLV